MSNKGLLDAIEGLLNEGANDHINQITAANQQKQKEQGSSPDTQGVLGKTTGAAMDAGGEKDVGGMEKGKFASDASSDAQGILGKTTGAALDAGGDKDVGKIDGKTAQPSGASSKVEADKGPHDQANDPGLKEESEEELEETKCEKCDCDSCECDDDKDKDNDKKKMSEESEEDLEEKLHGDQHKLDHNKNGKIDSSDMKDVRKKGATAHLNKEDFDFVNEETGESLTEEELEELADFYFENFEADAEELEEYQEACSSSKKKKMAEESDEDDKDSDDEDDDKDDDDKDLEEMKLPTKSGAQTKAHIMKKSLSRQMGNSEDGNKKVSLAGPGGKKITATKTNSTEPGKRYEEAEVEDQVVEAEGETLKKVSGEENAKYRPDAEKGKNEPETKKSPFDGHAPHDQAKDPIDTPTKANPKGAVSEESELDEDFKARAEVIFETAVNEKAAIIREEMQAEFDNLLTEEKAKLNEQVGGYVEEAVAEWISENALEIKYSLRTEIAENFIRGLKGLFEDSYVDIPEEDFAVVDELSEAVETYKEQLEEQNKALTEANTQILEMKKTSILESVSEDLTQTQRIKLESLAEHVEAADIEEFEYKLNELKEGYFDPKSEQPFIGSLTEEVFTGNQEQIIENVDPSVAVYANFLGKTVK